MRQMEQHTKKYGKIVDLVIKNILLCFIAFSE